MKLRSRNKPVFLIVAFALILWVVGGRAADRVDAIKLDWAYYNPVSLVLKSQGLLEEEFEKDNIGIEWAQSLGSNKALELLRSRSVDFGSTAGAAALLGRANGNPIKAIYVYSNPEWTALVTRPDSGIQRLQDLRGKRVAAKLTDAVAANVWERTDFTNSAIGPIHRETIRASGDILKQSEKRMSEADFASPAAL